MKSFNRDNLLIWEQISKPLYLGLTIPNNKKLNKYFSIGNFTTIVIYENETAKWLFFKNEEKEIGSKITKILKSEIYEELFRNQIKKSENKLNRIISLIENKKSFNKDEIKKLYLKLRKSFDDYFSYAVLVEPIEWYTEDEIKKLINKTKYKNDIDYLLKVEEDSIALEILKDLNKCYKNPTDKNINNHIKKYYWKNNNYYNISYITKEDILKELKTNPNIKNVENMIKEKETILNKKRSIMSNLSPNLNKLIHINNEFGGYLGDKRKKEIMKTSSAISILVKGLSKITNTSISDIEWLIPDEIIDYIDNYKFYKERIENRKKYFLMYQAEHSLIDEMILDDYKKKNNYFKLEEMNYPYIVEGTLVDSTLDSLNKYYDIYLEENKVINNLKGNPIYKDTRNKIKGIVRKIKNPKQDKILENEILVSSSTTPDFVECINKSLAVITDWGGMTSHAAIITRELKKPCIIGTNYATSYLNDGDLIELDMISGVIERINEK